jgi:hypothetical protein
LQSCLHLATTTFLVTVWSPIWAFRVSLRQACRASGTARSSMLYRSVRPDQAPLIGRIRGRRFGL